jgi:hypothetical protein
VKQLQFPDDHATMFKSDFRCEVCGWRKPFPHVLFIGPSDSGTKTARRLFEMKDAATATCCAWCVLRGRKELTDGLR